MKTYKKPVSILVNLDAEEILAGSIIGNDKGTTIIGDGKGDIGNNEIDSKGAGWDDWEE